MNTRRQTDLTNSLTAEVDAHNDRKSSSSFSWERQDAAAADDDDDDDEEDAAADAPAEDDDDAAAWGEVTIWLLLLRTGLRLKPLRSPASSKLSTGACRKN